VAYYISYVHTSYCRPAIRCYGDSKLFDFRALISALHYFSTNGDWFWIGWLVLLALRLQLQFIITAHNQWLPKTRSIPYWTTSVFSSTATDLGLIYESVTSSASVVHWKHSTAEHCTSELPSEFSYYRHPNESWVLSLTESYVTTDGQSASLSWNKPPMWGLRPDFCYCQTVAVLLIWGALSNEMTGLSFTIAAGPCQCSYSRVRVPWDSRPYFTASNSRLPFSPPPMTRRATVEFFDSASTRDWHPNQWCVPPPYNVGANWI
jgi:hypothetical protein